MSKAPQNFGGNGPRKHSCSPKVEESWFLRIDEKVIGPTTRAELERFLQPPRICRRMDVMCTSGPEQWQTVDPAQTLDDVLSLSGIATPITATGRRSPIGRIPLHLATLLSHLAAYRSFIAAALFLVAVNAFAWMLMRAPNSREREILKQYVSILQTIGHFREGKRPDHDWPDFARESIATVEAAVSELKRTSNVQTPVRQNLLYAGQDALMKLLSGNKCPNNGDSSFTILERYLIILENQLLTLQVTNGGKS